MPTFDEMSILLDPSKRWPGLSTGFIGLDDITTGLRPGELIVIAARPSMGKTALALNIAEHVAMKLGKPVAVFSLATSKESLLSRLLCGIARVDSDRFRGGFVNQAERRRLFAALNQLVQSPLHIDDTARISLMELHAKCRALRCERGLALVVIDYVQLMTGKGNYGQEISAVCHGLKRLTKELSVPIIALAQIHHQMWRRPELRDLRGLRPIEEDADLVAFIFREEVCKPEREDLYARAELLIAKQRNGPTGKVELAFLHKYTRFENRAEDLGEEAPPEAFE